ncbi:hypothetical protein V1521DRAFT_455867 [Lipomyces starkeyi]
MSYEAATSTATIESFENLVWSNMPVTIGRRIRQSVETCLADLIHIMYFGGLAHIHLVFHAWNLPSSGTSHGLVETVSSRA